MSPGYSSTSKLRGASTQCRSTSSTSSSQNTEKPQIPEYLRLFGYGYILELCGRLVSPRVLGHRRIEGDLPP